MWWCLCASLISRLLHRSKGRVSDGAVLLNHTAAWSITRPCLLNVTSVWSEYGKTFLNPKALKFTSSVYFLISKVSLMVVGFARTLYLNYSNQLYLSKKTLKNYSNQLWDRPWLGLNLVLLFTEWPVSIKCRWVGKILRQKINYTSVQFVISSFNADSNLTLQS